jgi:hypothetical protein
MGALILAIALIAACGAAAGWAPPRPHLGWTALALLILYFLLGAAGPLLPRF